MKKTLFMTAVIFALLLSAGCGKNNGGKTVENITRDTMETTKETKTGENQESTENAEIQNEETNETSDSVVLADILSEIKTKVSADGALDMDASAMNSLYGIDVNDISQSAGFVVMAGTFPHEVVMVEAKDEDAADRIEEKLNTKYESFVTQSKGYDAENYALACKCKVERKGKHISMFLSPDFETMTEIYSEYVK